MSEAHGHDSEKHDDKTFTIVVNARKRTVTGTEITFEDVVKLAFDAPPSGPNVVFTVTYRRGHGGKPEGLMVTGTPVKLKEGMIFDVSVTDKS